MPEHILIRKAAANDFDAIWEIIQAVISTGDTYSYAPNSSKEKMLAYWCNQDKHTFVACIEESIVGTFIIKDNNQDLGSHVANASFMTHPDKFGRGIGRTMGEFALAEAKRLGYYAMQFNLVVKSNEGAVRLWQKLGFEIMAEIPAAFNHQEKGLIPAYIMWKKL